MKGNRKTLFAVAALAVVAALMLGIWYFTRPQTQEGAKTVVVEVVHGDESAREFTYHADLEYLGELETAGQIRRAVDQVLAEGVYKTPDLGGSATTTQYRDAIIAHL